MKKLLFAVAPLHQVVVSLALIPSESMYAVGGKYQDLPGVVDTCTGVEGSLTIARFANESEELFEVTTYPGLLVAPEGLPGQVVAIDNVVLVPDLRIELNDISNINGLLERNAFRRQDDLTRSQTFRFSRPRTYEDHTYHCLLQTDFRRPVKMTLCNERHADDDRQCVLREPGGIVTQNNEVYFTVHDEPDWTARLTNFLTIHAMALVAILVSILSLWLQLILRSKRDRTAYA